MKKKIPKKYKKDIEKLKECWMKNVEISGYIERIMEKVKNGQDSIYLQKEHLSLLSQKALLIRTIHDIELRLENRFSKFTINSFLNNNIQYTGEKENT